MKQSWNKLKSACGSLAKSSPLALMNPNTRNGYVRGLMRALVEYQKSGEETHVLVFSDDIHGAAKVHHWGQHRDMSNLSADNEQWAIEVDDSIVVMTGAALDNICHQWIQKRGLHFRSFERERDIRSREETSK